MAQTCRLLNNPSLDFFDERTLNFNQDAMHEYRKQKNVCYYYHYIHNYRPSINHIFLIFQEHDFSVIQTDELVVAKHRNGR